MDRGIFHPPIAHLRMTRDEWPGDLVVKGVLSPDDARWPVVSGVDATCVSNHSAPQFEAGSGTIDQLPQIRKAGGDDTPLKICGHGPFQE